MLVVTGGGFPQEARGSLAWLAEPEWFGMFKRNPAPWDQWALWIHPVVDTETSGDVCHAHKKHKVCPAATPWLLSHLCTLYFTALEMRPQWVLRWRVCAEGCMGAMCLESKHPLGRKNFGVLKKLIY